MIHRAVLFLIVLGLVASCILAGAQIGMIICCGAALLISALPKSVRPKCLRFIGLALLPILCSAPLLEPPAIISVALRILTIMLLALATALDQSRQARSRPPATTCMVVLVLGIATYLCSSTAAHSNWSAFGLGFGELFALVVYIVIVGRSDRKNLLRSLTMMVFFAIVFCLLLGITDSPNSIIKGRLAGFFANANTLGFVGLLAIGLVVTQSRLKSVEIALSLGAAICILWSGSRASLLAACVTIAVSIVQHKRQLWWFAALVVCLGVFFLWRYGLIGVSASEGVLRLNNSREGVLDAAVVALQHNPLIGFGVTDLNLSLGSSIIGAFVNGGILGLIGITVAMAAVLKWSWSNRQYFAFTAGAIVHTFFESWFLSPVSPSLWLFIALCFGGYSVTSGTLAAQSTLTSHSVAT